jgi:hypothetical protein
MPLPLSTDARPVGMPAPKPRAPSLIAEALRALAERNRALGLTVQGTAPWRCDFDGAGGLIARLESAAPGVDAALDVERRRGRAHRSNPTRENANGKSTAHQEKGSAAKR